MSLSPLPSTDRISMDETGGKYPTYHKLSSWYQAWFSSIQFFLSALGANGTTANRPTKGLYVGYPYLDTTLGKPIWVKSLGPTVWIDATGGVV